MPRLMSVTLTEQAVAERRKTVTRRLGWWTNKHGRRLLQPGDQLTLCRKVQGRRRKDGTVEPLVRLCTVEVVSVRRELVRDITDSDIIAEGVDPARFEATDDDTGQPPTWEWTRWFCAEQNCHPGDIVTRIEWRYPDQEDTTE